MNPNRSVAVLNYSNKYISDIFTLMNSPELREVVRLFLAERGHEANGNSFEDTNAETYLETIKSVLLDRGDAYEHFTREEMLQSIEDLYSFYRSYLRIAVLNMHRSDVMANNFMEIDNQFNDLVIRLYRTVEEKLQGFSNKTYRQVSAGSSACILTQSQDWPMPKGYEALKPIRFIDTLMLRPPMMMTTPSNKRKGRLVRFPITRLQNFMVIGMNGTASQQKLAKV